ncbi:MAG: SYNERG-CTERM sorting domain-containing protein [Synergistaceae bacterium]|nr:SYNERG-CTERM sorting domain-containing protein [Synergistaceae bacterium]
MKKRYLFLALLILVYASSAFAANYPNTPYGGSNNVAESSYPSAIENYFNQNMKVYDNPTFTIPGWSTFTRGANNIGRATAHEDMLNYIEALPRTNMQLRYVAEIYTYDNENSPPGLGIPMKSFKYPLLVFTKEGVFDPADVKALGRPIVHLEGSIHGGEISAQESMMPLAKRLATPGADLNSLLDKVSVIMVPRYNVDGVFKYQRGTDSIQPRYYSSVANQAAGTVGRVAGVDQNRDNTGFESPIVRLIHMIWDAYEPHFIADGHQMGATIGTSTWFDFDIATLYTSNPNTPEELDELAHDGITIKPDPIKDGQWNRDNPDSLEHLAKRALRDAGLEWWNYIGTSYGQNTTGPNPFEYFNGTSWIAAGATANYQLANGGYQEGNPEEGITDSAARIKGAFGLLAEGRTPGGITLNYNRRVQAHETVYAEMVKAFADPVKGPILKDAVDRARVAMATGTSVRDKVNQGDLVIALQNQDPVSAEIEIPGERGVPVLRLVRNPNLVSGDPGWDTPVVSKDFHPIRISRSRRVIALPEADRPFSTVKRPTAYIIKCDDAAAARIAYTGVRIERLAESATVPVEYYTVTGFGSNVNFRGVYNVTVSQLPTGITAATKDEKTMTFAKDTYVIFMDQYHSVHASLTVEPSGGRNFGNYWYNRAEDSKKGFLPVALSDDYPAYRYMGNASALKTYFAYEINMLPFVMNTHIEWPLMLTQEKKAQFVSGLLTDKTELLAFSSFTVNALAADFEAYLRKTEKDGVWYAWNWSKGKAEKIAPRANGYAMLTTDNIGSGNEVIMFKITEETTCTKPHLPICEEEGCNAGYAAYALLLLVPFVARKRK